MTQDMYHKHCNNWVTNYECWNEGFYSLFSLFNLICIPFYELNWLSTLLLYQIRVYSVKYTLWSNNQLFVLNNYCHYYLSFITVNSAQLKLYVWSGAAAAAAARWAKWPIGGDSSPKTSPEALQPSAEFVLLQTQWEVRRYHKTRWKPSSLHHTIYWHTLGNQLTKGNNMKFYIC